MRRYKQRRSTGPNSSSIGRRQPDAVPSPAGIEKTTTQHQKAVEPQVPTTGVLEVIPSQAATTELPVTSPTDTIGVSQLAVQFVCRDLEESRDTHEKMVAEANATVADLHSRLNIAQQQIAEMTSWNAMLNETLSNNANTYAQALALPAQVHAAREETRRAHEALDQALQDAQVELKYHNSEMEIANVWAREKNEALQKALDKLASTRANLSAEKERSAYYKRALDNARTELLAKPSVPIRGPKSTLDISNSELRAPPFKIPRLRNRTSFSPPPLPILRENRPLPDVSLSGSVFDEEEVTITSNRRSARIKDLPPRVSGSYRLQSPSEDEEDKETQGPFSSKQDKYRSARRERGRSESASSKSTCQWNDANEDSYAEEEEEEEEEREEEEEEEDGERERCEEGKDGEDDDDGGRYEARGGTVPGNEEIHTHHQTETSASPLDKGKGKATNLTMAAEVKEWDWGQVGGDNWNEDITHLWAMQQSLAPLLEPSGPSTSELRNAPMENDESLPAFLANMDEEIFLASTPQERPNVSTKELDIRQLEKGSVAEKREFLALRRKTRHQKNPRQFHRLGVEPLYKAELSGGNRWEDTLEEIVMPKYRQPVIPRAGAANLEVNKIPNEVQREFLEDIKVLLERIGTNQYNGYIPVKDYGQEAFNEVVAAYIVQIYPRNEEFLNDPWLWCTKMANQVSTHFKVARMTAGQFSARCRTEWFKGDLKSGLPHHSTDLAETRHWTYNVLVEVANIIENATGNLRTAIKRCRQYDIMLVLSDCVGRHFGILHSPKSILWCLIGYKHKLIHYKKFTPNAVKPATTFLQVFYGEMGEATLKAIERIVDGHNPAAKGDTYPIYNIGTNDILPQDQVDSDRTGTHKDRTQMGIKELTLLQGPATTESLQLASEVMGMADRLQAHLRFKKIGNGHKAYKESKFKRSFTLAFASKPPTSVTGESLSELLMSVMPICDYPIESIHVEKNKIRGTFTHETFNFVAFMISPLWLSKVLGNPTISTLEDESPPCHRTSLVLFKSSLKIPIKGNMTGSTTSIVEKAGHVVQSTRGNTASSLPGALVISPTMAESFKLFQHPGLPHLHRVSPALQEFWHSTCTRCHKLGHGSKFCEYESTPAELARDDNGCQACKDTDEEGWVNCVCTDKRRVGNARAGKCPTTRSAADFDRYLQRAGEKLATSVGGLYSNSDEGRKFRMDLIRQIPPSPSLEADSNQDPAISQSESNETQTVPDNIEMSRTENEVEYRDLSHSEESRACENEEMEGIEYIKSKMSNDENVLNKGEEVELGEELGEKDDMTTKRLRQRKRRSLKRKVLGELEGNVVENNATARNMAGKEK